MSWLFSQALVEAYSAARSLDGEPFALLNVMPTAHKFWRNDKTIDPSRLSRFGLTCRVLTAAHGEALLMSFLAGFRARTSAQPERVPVSMESDRDYGDTWRGSLARYDPDSCSWRTLQLSFLEDLSEYSETFPRSGMTRHGLLWELPTLGPRISVTGSGLWPTPVASDSTRSSTSYPRGNRTLVDLARTFPTPCAMDARSWRFNKSASKGAAPRPTLAMMARRDLWPTPTVSGNSNRAGASRKSGDGLSTAVKRWPSPIASDWRSGKASEKTASKNSRPLREKAGGLLNPVWVEWLMGWPLGWTDLGHSAMDKYRSAWLKPGKD